MSRRREQTLTSALAQKDPAQNNHWQMANLDDMESSASMERTVFAARLVLGSILASAVLFPQQLQPSIDAAWAWLTSRSLYNASYFETIWTVALYIAFETYYVALATSDKPRPPMPKRIDVRAGRAHLWRNGTVRVRKIRGRLFELVLYVGPLLFLDLVLIKKFKGVSWEDMVSSGGYDPIELSSRMASKGSALNATIAHAIDALPANIGTQHFLAPSIHKFSWANPLQTKRALPARAPSSRSVAIELISSLVIYDAVFFITHLALHKVPYLYRHVHATHHDHAEIHAQVTNQLDIGERLLLILTANFALQIIGAHVFTRTLFVPTFVLMLVQNHTGLNVLSYDKLLPSGWGAGPIIHAQHHRMEKTGYAPYLRWCDLLYERLTGQYGEMESLRSQDAIRQTELGKRRLANLADAGDS